MTTLHHSDSDEGATQASRAFSLLDRNLRKWMWGQGWTSLRSIQEEAILLLLGDCHEDIVICAPTAGGKTEAVYLPLLTKIAKYPAGSGFRILYVSPLRALIDDQYERIGQLADIVDVKVTRWHGDVGRAEKVQTQRVPSGVLMITPESLEAFFVLRSGLMRQVFGNLEYIVVDELHSFMPSERGRQLQSQLSRLQALTANPPKRIGLSATIGDARQACDYLRPPSNTGAITIVSEDKSELLIALHAFAEGASGDLPPASRISDLLFRKLRGHNNLAFVNTRQGVEQLSDTLRRRSEALSVPNEFLPHHGSLSRTLRHLAESSLRKVGKPTTVICTSTLELGIDVGQIESVAQIGAAPSVSSIAQRLGRSGRRGNPSVLRCFVTTEVPEPDSHLEDHLHLELVEAIAQLELLLEGWCEAPSAGEKHFSTLLHQVLSVICERGGVDARSAWRTLCSIGPFRNVTKAEFAALLRQMGQERLVEQAPNGVLLLGEKGEQLQKRRDFYAVFQTPDEYSLIGPEGPLGTLPIRFPLIPGNHLIFGGTRWMISSVDERRQVVVLEPSPAGKVPKFSGNGWLVGDEVRERMKEVLLGSFVPAYLDPTGRELLHRARRVFSEAQLDSTNIVGWGEKTCLFCWRGDRIRLTLRTLLESFGVKVTLFGVALGCGCTSQELVQVLLKVGGAEPPDAVRLASKVTNKATHKYDFFLGDELLEVDYAARVFKPSETIRYVQGILPDHS